MRVTVGPSGTLIASPTRTEPVSGLLSEVLATVAACEIGARPFFYELEGDRAILLGTRPLGPPITFADGSARRGEVTKGSVSSRHDAAPLEPVRFLLETVGGPGIVCFVDLTASSVASIAGGETDRTTWSAELFELAAAAGLGPVELRHRRSGEAGRRSATVDELAASAGRHPMHPGSPVLVFADERDGEDLAGLLQLARSSPGLGVVVSGAVASPDVVLGVGSPPVAYLRAPVGTRTRAETDGPEAETSRVEIGILGPTEITGGQGSLAGRPRLTELVVYLAMHPGGATAKTWSAALWPERRVPPQTVANRLSEARGLLGFAADGRPRLRRSGERHLVADVDTDWARFARLAASSLPERWQEALALVRGRPFDDLAEGSWTVLEGFVGEIERAVVECALRLGEHCLANHDADGAAFAARMAIRASPWDERLHRLLMRSADAAGNRSGIEEILQHLALVLEVDGDPLGGVHPETAALYARLSGRTPAGH